MSATRATGMNDDTGFFPCGTDGKSTAAGACPTSAIEP